MHDRSFTTTKPGFEKRCNLESHRKVSVCFSISFLCSAFEQAGNTPWIQYLERERERERERGGDSRTVASCQGALSKCWKREKRGWVLIGGWCGSECHGVFHQQLSTSAHALVSRP